MESTVLPIDCELDEQVTNEKNNNNNCKEAVIDAVRIDDINGNDDVIIASELFDFDSSDLDDNSDTDVNDEVITVENVKNDESIDTEDVPDQIETKLNETQSLTNQTELSANDTKSSTNEIELSMNESQLSVNETSEKINEVFHDIENEPIFDFLGKSNEIVCENKFIFFESVEGSKL